jgi:hypothetical protein
MKVNHKDPVPEKWGAMTTTGCEAPPNRNRYRNPNRNERITIKRKIYPVEKITSGKILQLLGPAHDTRASSKKAVKPE